MEIKGTIHEIMPTEQVTDKFKKRAVIIEYIENNPQYPEYISIGSVQDKCAILDNFKIGDSVEVFFNIKGRPHTNTAGVKNYYNQLQLCKINKV
jgi:hypothetical protein